jgi:hypothetical protein
VTRNSIFNSCIWKKKLKKDNLPYVGYCLENDAGSWCALVRARQAACSGLGWRAREGLAWSCWRRQAVPERNCALVRALLLLSGVWAQGGCAWARVRVATVVFLESSFGSTVVLYPHGHVCRDCLNSFITHGYNEAFHPDSVYLYYMSIL